MANIKDKFKNCRSIILLTYLTTQILLLFCLRLFFLRTVFQTVASYLAVCVLGLFMVFMARLRADKSIWKSLRDSYLILWSGFHGIIVLGFMTCGTYYLTLTEVTLVQIINIFLGFALYWFFYLWTRAASAAMGWGNLFIGIVGTVNYYLMRFRGAPFRISDFKSAGTAFSVAGNYDFTPDILLIIAVADLILWFVVWKVYLRKNPMKKRWHLWKVLGTAVISCGCIALPLMNFKEIYANTLQFAQDTYLATFVAELMGSSKAMPEGYSTEEVERIVSEYRQCMIDNPEENKNAEGETPNIVVIMNEAFSDLRVLGEFETNMPVLPYWDSLYEDCVKGWAYVSVLGGSTANSEYEFLSSDAVALYGNEIPYNRYFDSSREYPSLVSILEEQGYSTLAFHPYLSSGWNRTQVYRAMGFDEILFQEDLEQEPDSLRIYTSDKGNYDIIKGYFDKKQEGEPLFVFNVTMQNHGGYTYEGDNFEPSIQLTGEAAGQFPQADQYLSLIRESDLALKELLEYFQAYEEPVIVVMFGDHQPRLEDAFYEYITGVSLSNWSLEQRMNQYKTPFIIWHNYDTEEADVGELSLNYLAPLVLDDAGLYMSEYQQFVKQQYEKYPVIMSLGMQDATGHIFPRGSEEYMAGTIDYRWLVYNHTAEKENRYDSFFGWKE